MLLLYLRVQDSVCRTLHQSRQWSSRGLSSGGQHGISDFFFAAYVVKVDNLQQVVETPGWNPEEPERTSGKMLCWSMQQRIADR
jgi:hypothetical protein